MWKPGCGHRVGAALRVLVTVGIVDVGAGSVLRRRRAGGAGLVNMAGAGVVIRPY